MVKAMNTNHRDLSTSVNGTNLGKTCPEMRTHLVITMSFPLIYFFKCIKVVKK